MLFSATVTAKTREQAQKMMQEPLLIDVPDQGDSRPDIEHLYFVAEQRDKIEVLRKLMHSLQVKRALVFVNRAEDIEITVAKLNHHGLKAAGLHGGSFKNERKQSLIEFRKGKLQLLVASDLAARGLDIPGVEYVFNLDLPEQPQVYLHRAGRTGRAGAKGTALCILNPREAGWIERFERVLKIEIKAKTIARGQLFDSRKRPEDYKPAAKKPAVAAPAAATRKPSAERSEQPAERPRWQPPATLARPAAGASQTAGHSERSRPTQAAVKTKQTIKSAGHSSVAPWAKPGTKPNKPNQGRKKK